MAVLTLYGSISEDGTIVNGSGNFYVKHVGSGQYQIHFNVPFSSAPAIVGSQNNFGTLDQDPRDGCVFPFVTNENAIVIVSDNAGEHCDRSFSFIAIGTI